MNDDTDADRIAYNYRPLRSKWNEWKRTVRRDKALDVRLDELLELDRDHDLEGLIEQAAADELGADVDRIADAIEQADPGEETVRLSAVRIRRRCMTALPDARENGADRAAEELAEIQQIANDLLELQE